MVEIFIVKRKSQTPALQNLRVFCAFMAVLCSIFIMTEIAIPNNSIAQNLELQRTQKSSEIAQSLSKNLFELFDVEKGERIEIFKVRMQGKNNALVYVTISSDILSFSVLEGEVKIENLKAFPGDTIVKVLENEKLQKFQFDASVLKRGLDKSILNKAGPPLERIIAKQKSERFWGLLTPANMNAVAPIGSEIEKLRAQYLNFPAIIETRISAKSDKALLCKLSTQKFRDAMIAKEVETIASLIDPKPFIDVTFDKDRWQNARLNFAKSLIKNDGLLKVLSVSNLTEVPQGFGVGTELKIETIERDNACFIAQIGPQK